MEFPPPSDVKFWTYILVGEKWPEGDEHKLRELARVWRELATDLVPVDMQILDAANGVRKAGNSPSIRAAVDYLEKLGAGKSPARTYEGEIKPKDDPRPATGQMMDDIRYNIERVAVGAEQIALEIEYSKIMISLMAMYLAYTVLKLLKLAVATMGGSLTAIPPVIMTFQQFAAKLLLRLVQNVIAGMIFMVGLDAVTQLIQIFITHSRSWQSWDTEKTLFNAGLGAFGGALNWGLGWMRKLPGGKSLPFSMVKDSITEAVPELLGPGDGKDESFVGGGISGGFEGAIGHGTKHFGKKTGSPHNLLIDHLGIPNLTPPPPPPPTQDGAVPDSDPPPPYDRGNIPGQQPDIKDPTLTINVGDNPLSLADQTVGSPSPTNNQQGSQPTATNEPRPDNQAQPNNQTQPNNQEQPNNHTTPNNQEQPNNQAQPNHQTAPNNQTAPGSESVRDQVGPTGSPRESAASQPSNSPQHGTSGTEGSAGSEAPAATRTVPDGSTVDGQAPGVTHEDTAAEPVPDSSTVDDSTRGTDNEGGAAGVPDGRHPDGLDGVPGQDGTGSGEKGGGQQGGSQSESALPSSPVYWRPGGERQAYLLLNGPDGLSVTGSEHGVGLFRDKPPVVSAGQTLIRVTLPADTSVIDLTATPREANGVARQAVADGRDLLLPQLALDQVRVDKVYRPGSGWAGGKSWLGGATWQAVSEQTGWSWFTGTGQAWRPSSGKTLAELYRPWTTEPSADPRSLADLLKFAALSPMSWVDHAYAVLGGPDGSGLVGGPHSVGLFRNKPPVIAPGQTLVRVVMPEGTAIDLTETLRRRPEDAAVPEVKQALIDGHDLLLPRWDMDGVRVDKVYEPSPASGRTNGLAWQETPDSSSQSGPVWRSVSELHRPRSVTAVGSAPVTSAPTTASTVDIKLPVMAQQSVATSASGVTTPSTTTLTTEQTPTPHVAPATAPRKILSGAYLPGPPGNPTDLPGEALRSHLGYFTVAAHFDRRTGRVLWGNRSLSARELADLIPTLPGWADAVADAGGTPRVIVVSCGVSSTPPGSQAYLADVAELMGIELLGATGDAVQQPTGDIVVEPDAHDRSDDQPPEWLLHHGNGGPPTRLGADLTRAIGELAGNVPAIAVTPDQDGMTGPYRWADDAQQVTTPAGNTVTRVDARTYEVTLPGSGQGTPRILITRGDILQQPTQAIVNAANVNLAHGGGVADKIANAGGRNAQHRRHIDVSSARALKDRGVKQLNVGDAVTTPSHHIGNQGQQTITHVIHTVGPDYRIPAQEDAQLLYDAVYSVLREADANNLTSVTIPQISTAIFRMPVPDATTYTARALLDTTTNVREIRLVLYDQTDTDALNFADLLFQGATTVSPRGPSPHVTPEGIKAGLKPKLKAVARPAPTPVRTSTSKAVSDSTATGAGRPVKEVSWFSQGRMQQQLREHQVEPVTVPGDNNCFYHSLIEVAGPHITQHVPGMRGLVGPRRLQGVGVLRNWLADRLAADFEVANRGLPSRYASHFRFNDRRDIAAQQQEYVRQIRQMHSWNNEAGDSVAYFAATELGLPMTLIQDRYTTPVGPPGDARIPFIRIPNHYMGARYTAGDPGIPWDTLRPQPPSADDEARLLLTTLIGDQQEAYHAARARLDTVLPQLPQSVREEFNDQADTTAARLQLALDRERYQHFPGYRRVQRQLDDVTGARFDLERMVGRAERRLQELATALEVLRLFLDPGTEAGNRVTALVNQDFGGAAPAAVTAVREAGAQLTAVLREAADLFADGVTPEQRPSGLTRQQADNASEVARRMGSALSEFNQALQGVHEDPLVPGEMLDHDLNTIAAFALQRDEDLARALQDEAEGNVRWVPIQEQLGPLALGNDHFHAVDVAQDAAPEDPDSLAWEQLTADWEAFAAQFDTATRGALENAIGTVPEGATRDELTRGLTDLDRAYGDALQTMTDARERASGNRVPHAAARDQIRARTGAVRDRITNLQLRIDAARTTLSRQVVSSSQSRVSSRRTTTAGPSSKKLTGGATTGSSSTRRRGDATTSSSSKPPVAADKPLGSGQVQAVTRGVPAERAWEQLTRAWDDLDKSYTATVADLENIVDDLTSTTVRGPLRERIAALRTDRDALANLMKRAADATTGEQVPNALVRSHLTERIAAFQSRLDDVRTRVEAADEAAQSAAEDQDPETEEKQDKTDQPDDRYSARAQAADQADQNRIFAPPAYTTRADLRQALGPHTSEPVDNRLVDQLRKLVLDSFPEELHAEVDQLLDDKLTEDTLAKDMEQVVGEELSLFFKTSKGTYLVTLTLHLGDWTQLTDPRGNLLDENFADHYHLPGKNEIRTRQVHESTSSVGTSRTVANEFGIGGSVELGKGYHDGDGFNAIRGNPWKATLPVHKTSRTHASGTSATTTRYVKGSSYRAVDFLHDVGAIVTVQKAGEGIQVAQSIIEQSLIMRYSRETLRHLDRPDPTTTYATSALWSDLTSQEEASTAAIQELYEIVGDDPAARSDSAQHRTLIPPEPIPTDAQLGDPHEIPRTSWIEALNGSSGVRAAILTTVNPALTTPGSASHQSLTTFATVGNLKGGLHQANNGGTMANPVSERNALGILQNDSVLVTVSLYQGTVLVEEDAFSRVDTEDTYVSSTSQPVTKSDNVNSSRSVTAAFGKIVTGAPTLPLSWERSVSQSQPGIGAGSVVLHKLKFTREPQSLVGFTAVYTVRSLTDPTRVQRVKGYTVVRMLKADALRDDQLAAQFTDPVITPSPMTNNLLGASHQDLTLLRPSRPSSMLSVATQSSRASMVELENAATDEATRRRSGNRMLVMPPQFTGWLPPFSRISRWGAEAVRVLDRTVELIVRQFPEFLPGIQVLAETPTGGGSRVRFGPEWLDGFDNFLTLWNALNPEKLAGRLHKMAGGGEEILLPLPGNVADRHLAVRLNASYDRTQFRYERTLGGQVEVYYGNFWDLVSATSRGWSVSTGLDVPLGFTKAAYGALKEFDLKFAPRVAWSASTTDKSGFGAGGAIGGGSDWMAEFSGRFTFDVSVEKVTVNRPKEQMPGSYPGAPTYTGLGGDVEAGVTVTKELATAEPFDVRANLLVSEDLSLEVNLPSTETRTFPDIPTPELYTLPTRSTLKGAKPDQDWTPDPESEEAPARLPQDALLTPNTAPLLSTVQQAFARLGVATLSPNEHTELATRLYTAGPQFRDYQKRPRRVWRGRLKWGPFRDTMAEVRLQVQVTKLSALGSSDHAYRYLHSLGTSFVGRSSTTDHFNKSFSTELGFPVKFDVDAINQIGPSGSLRYGRNDPVTDSVTDFGGFDRVEIDIGHQVWAGVDLTWTAQVLVWDAGVGSHGGPQVGPTGTSDPPGTVTVVTNAPNSSRGTPPVTTATTRMTSEEVDVAGLALMPYQHAVDRNLVIAAEEVVGPQPASAFPGASASQAWTVLLSSIGQDQSRVSLSTNGGGGVAPGSLLPPSNTLRGDGIGHAVKMETPELDQTQGKPGFHQAAMGMVRQAFPPEVADAIEIQLEKITSIKATDALLEDMLTGLSVLIPDRGGLTASIATMTIKATLTNPRHEGPPQSLKVLERKNARGHQRDTGRGTAGTWSLAGGTSQAHSFGGVRPLQEQGTALSVTGSRSTERGLNSTVKHEESFGLLSVLHPEQFRFDVHLDFTVELDTALIAELNLTTGDIARWHERAHLSGVVRNGLLLGYPKQISQPDPRAMYPVVTDGSHETGNRTDDADDRVSETASIHIIDDSGEHIPLEPLDEQGRSRKSGGQLVGPSVAAATVAQSGTDPLRPERPDHAPTRTVLPPGQHHGALRRGLPLNSTLLAESDIETVGNIPQLRKVAKSLFDRPGVRTKLFGDETSWQTGKHRLFHKIDVTLTNSFLVRNGIGMIEGDGYREDLTEPGMLWDSGGTFEISADVLEWEPVDYDPVTGVTLTDAITKDFERRQTVSSTTHKSAHGISGSLTPVNLKLSDNVDELPKKPGTDAPDTTTMRSESGALSLNRSVRFESASTASSPAVLWEKGDKTTFRDYTRMAAKRVRWNFSWRPGDDEPAQVVSVEISDEAMVFWTPTQRVPDLLDLVPISETEEADAEGTTVPPRSKPEAFDETTDPEPTDTAALRSDVTGLQAQIDAWTAGSKARTDRQIAVVALFDAATKAGLDVTAIRRKLADARAAFIHQGRLLYGLQITDDQQLSTLSGKQLRALRNGLQGWLAAADQLSDAIEAAERVLGETAAPSGMTAPIVSLRNELASLTTVAPRRDADLRQLYRIIDGANAAGIDVDGIDEALAAAEEGVQSTQDAGKTAADVTANPEDLTVPLAYQQQPPLQAYVDSLNQLDAAIRTQRGRLHELLRDNAGAVRGQVQGFGDAVQQDTDATDERSAQETLLQDWLDAADDADADADVAALRRQLNSANENVRQAREAMYWPDDTRSVNDLTPEQLAQVYPGMRDLSNALRRRNDAMAEVRNQLQSDAPTHKPPTKQESVPVRRELAELRKEEEQFNSAGRTVHIENEQELLDWLETADDNEIDVAEPRKRLDDASRALQDAEAAIPRYDDLTPDAYTPRQATLQRDALSRFFGAVKGWQQAMDVVKGWLTTNAPGHAPVSAEQQLTRRLKELKQRLYTVRSTTVKSAMLDAKDTRLRRELQTTTSDQVTELRTRLDTSSRAVTDLVDVVTEFTKESLDTFDARKLDELTGTLDELDQALTDRTTELAEIAEQLTGTDEQVQQPDPEETQRLRDQLAALQEEGLPLRDRYDETLATVDRLHQWMDAATEHGLDIAEPREALNDATRQFTNAENNLPDIGDRTDPTQFTLAELQTLIPLLADLMASWRGWYDTVADVEQRLTRIAPDLTPVTGMTIEQVRREIRDIHRSLSAPDGDEFRNQRWEHLTSLRDQAGDRGIDLTEINQRLDRADEAFDNARAAFGTAGLQEVDPDTFTEAKARNALPHYRTFRNRLHAFDQEILRAVSEITQLLDITPPPLPTRPTLPGTDTTTTTAPDELFQIGATVTASVANELRNLVGSVGFLLTEDTIGALIDHRIALATGSGRAEVARLADRLREAIENVGALGTNIQADNQAQTAIQALRHLQRRLQRFNQALRHASADPLVPRHDDGSPSLPSDLLPGTRPPVTPGRAWQVLHYLRDPDTWHFIVREASTASNQWQLGAPSSQARQAITDARDALLHGIDQSILDLPDLAPPSQLAPGQQRVLVRAAAQLLLLMSTFNQSIADNHTHRPPSGAPPSMSMSIGVTVVHRTGGGPRARLGRFPYAEAPTPGTLTDLALATLTDFQDNWSRHHKQFTRTLDNLPAIPPPDALVTADQLRNAWDEVSELVDGVDIPDEVPDPEHGTRTTDYAERVRRAFHRFQTLLELAGPVPDDDPEANTGGDSDDGGGRRDSAETDTQTPQFFRPPDHEQQQQQEQQDPHQEQPPDKQTEPPSLDEDTTTALRNWDDIQHGHEAVLTRLENARNTAGGGTLPRRVADTLDQYTATYNDLADRIDQLARRARAGNASPADRNQLRSWVAQLQRVLEEVERLLVTSTVHTGATRTIEDILRNTQ